MSSSYRAASATYSAGVSNPLHTAPFSLAYPHCTPTWLDYRFASYAVPERIEFLEALLDLFEGVVNFSYAVIVE